MDSKASPFRDLLNSYYSLTACVWEDGALDRDDMRKDWEVGVWRKEAACCTGNRTVKWVLGEHSHVDRSCCFHFWEQVAGFPFFL